MTSNKISQKTMICHGYFLGQYLGRTDVAYYIYKSFTINYDDENFNLEEFGREILKSVIDYAYDNGIHLHSVRFINKEIFDKYAIKKISN